MQKTDWNSYYEQAFWASHFTRKYTTKVIINMMLRHTKNISNPSIVEFGGGNSCFYDAIESTIPFTSYTVVDTNPTGIEQFQARTSHENRTHTMTADVLESPCTDNSTDIVYSAGLIEHFDEAGTFNAIRSHFSCAKPGGLVLMTFPTPTWLYRMTRATAERLDCWAFPDERPLLKDEVTDAISQFGTVLEAKTLWPIILTQGCVAASCA